MTLGIVSVVFLIAFEATAVGTAMPVAARELHGLGLYAFAFSGFFTTSLLAMAASGEWCDARGPLVPLFTGIGVFAGGLVIAGTSLSMWEFVLGRAVQGLGGGLVIVALYVVVGQAFPERLRPHVFAAFSAAWVVPSIVGPLVSGTVTEQLGWRWVFLSIPVLVLLPVLVMLPGLRRLPRGGGGTFGRRRVLLALGVAVGAGLLEYAGQHLSWVALAPAAVGAALLVPCVVRLLPAGTFRSARGLPSVILLRGIAAGSFISAESFVPLMLVQQRHISPTLAGLSLAGGGLTWAAGARLQARAPLVHRPGGRAKLNRIAMVLVAISVAGASAGLLHALPAWVVAVAWAVGGAGMGMVITSLSVQMMDLSKPEEAGANSASLQVCDSLGNVMLTGLAGAFFASLRHVGDGSLAFAVIYWTMAGIALTGAVLAVRTRAGAT
ncbi:MFS transporter [Mangrovactinospora gilvigrisea]|uniref:MFS transporter n=1 Tax=Mangrovactinospora gilvigrisea TaxID=1428644 RepID=A0A1J7C7A0_9ACTN|nr:MFS transporter [Mangrovactinospora gilvigrisea]OIV37424.1 MFS transporter [Mangrovactinospora gilvigrisea]